MDESRKQFEAWRISDSPTSNLYRDSHGQYAEIGTWIAWKAWQASRAAIEIELPEADLVYSSATDSYGIEGCMMLPESLVERVLQEAGIKVKE